MCVLLLLGVRAVCRQRSRLGAWLIYRNQSHYMLYGVEHTGAVVQQALHLRCVFASNVEEVCTH